MLGQQADSGNLAWPACLSTGTSTTLAWVVARADANREAYAAIDSARLACTVTR